MLTAGEHALASLHSSIFSPLPRALSEKGGVGSTAKMCGSVMLKGVKALIERLCAARHYEAGAVVRASLRETFRKMRCS
jgi:hypothetical protein